MGGNRCSVSRSALAALLSMSLLCRMPASAIAEAVEEVSAGQPDEPTLVAGRADGAVVAEDDIPSADDAILVEDAGIGAQGDDESGSDEDDPVPPPPSEDETTVIADGTCGSCTWVLDKQGSLTIAPADGKSGTLLLEGEPADVPDGSNVGTWPLDDYYNEVVSIVIEQGVSIAGDASYAFASCPNLQTADVAQLDVSGVTNMSSMFCSCDRLESVDLSTWDTSNVTSMEEMFSGCSSLEEVEAARLVRARTQSISLMFSGCSKLEKLDVGGWDTSGVQSAKSTFESCGALTSLDVGGWDVGQVTDMAGAFQGCSGLESLDLSRWNTAKVTDMGGLFQSCERLASIKFGTGWGTSEAVDMTSLFSGCVSLTALDLSTVSTRTATSVVSMFEGCSQLKEVKFGKNFSLRPDLGEMGCRLPDGYEWRSAAGDRYASDEVPEYKEDTYTRVRLRSTVTIGLKVAEPSLAVTCAGKDVVTAANVSVSKASGTSAAVFSNVSSEGAARKFVVDAETGAVTVPAGTGVGTYTVRIRVDVPGNDNYNEACAEATFELVVKKANTLRVSTKKASVSVTYAASKAVAVGKNISAEGAKGALTYANASTNATAKKFSVDAKNGAVSVPKGTAAGTYPVVVKVRAAGDSTYAPKTVKVSFGVVVKKAAWSIKLAAQTMTYTGRALAYKGKVTGTGSAGKVTYAYYRDAKCAKSVKAANVKAAGTYYVKATVAADDNHKAATSAAAKLTVAKAANPLAARAVARTASLKTLKTKAVTVAVPLSVTKHQGKLTYAKVSGDSRLTVNAGTGRVTVKRGTPAKTYSLKLKVSAAGTANYKAGSRTITCKVTVK